MALTELQQPTKADFYRDLQGMAGEIQSRMQRWEWAADFLDNMGTEELDALGVPNTGTIRADIVKFRTMLRDIRALFNNETVTPTNDPKVVCESVRKMLII